MRKHSRRGHLEVIDKPNPASNYRNLNDVGDLPRMVLLLLTGSDKLTSWTPILDDQPKTCYFHIELLTKSCDLSLRRIHSVTMKNFDVFYRKMSQATKILTRIIQSEQYRNDWWIPRPIWAEWVKSANKHQCELMWFSKKLKNVELYAAFQDSTTVRGHGKLIAGLICSVQLSSYQI